MRAAPEDLIQEQVRALLTCAGYVVRCTTVRGWRASRGYGTDPGIPDLLVTHASWAGAWLGIEMKSVRTSVSDTQRALAEAGMIRICRSVEDAASAVVNFECAHGFPPRARRVFATILGQ